MPETNGQAAETQQAETHTVADRGMSRGDVGDITKLILGESNAQAEEITRRRADGDAELGTRPDRPEGGKDNGESRPDFEKADAEAGIAKIPSEPQADADKPREGKAPRIESFKALAEAAGIDLAALYELTISFGDGQGVNAEPVKLGAIKDAFQKGLDLDARSDELETATAKFENEQIVKNQAIESALESLNLTPQQIDAQTARVADNKLREQQKLFQVVPELAKSAELRQQTRAEIVELVKPYGISAVEIDSLADHRFYKFAMDAVNWRRLIAEASANAKRVRKTGKSIKPSRKFDGKGKSASTKTDALVDTAKTTRNVGDQVAAISALLGDKPNG